MDADFDSGDSSDYSLLGRMYKTRSLPGVNCVQDPEDDEDAQYLEAVPGWDSGVGSDCFPGLEMDSGEVIGGEFASEGSGVLASEEREQSECTCDDRHQPDSVKVIIAQKKVHVTSSTKAPQTDQKLRELRTLKQHYYPEGGWGWVILCVSSMVHILILGSQIVLASIIISLGKPNTVSRRLQPEFSSAASWLAPLSSSVSLLISPLSISLCRLRSTRLTAVSGGLIVALSCLFSSFATQFHQLIISLGLIQGIGVSFTRDAASLMLGQYFKRRREIVEIFLVSCPGIGIILISKLVHNLLRRLGWRFGLQILTLILTATFFLGMFYRSASLYHPQRRAIMHLKNQKRKIKMKKDDKTKLLEEKVPVIDFYVLKSKTIKILLTSTAVTSLGLNTPVFYLIEQASLEGLRPREVETLQVMLGLAWATGCLVFGLMVVRKSQECSVSRQYLTQAANILCGTAIMALTQVRGHSGYLIFVWVYGIFLGGHQYALKMYLFEKVRARNFANAWGFVQFSQGVSILLGVPITGYINDLCGCKMGYFFSAVCVLSGGLMMTFIDIHKRINRAKRRRRHKRDTMSEDPGSVSHHDTAEHEKYPDEKYNNKERRNSFPEEEDEEVFIPELVRGERDFEDLDVHKKPELTCISEEGIADMELPDNLLDELEILENITSCNKVENYLMLSEYEQNLSKENDSEGGDLAESQTKRGRRWSFMRQSSGHSDKEAVQRRRGKTGPGRRGWRHNTHSVREITTIEEDSV